MHGESGEFGEEAAPRDPGREEIILLRGELNGGQSGAEDDRGGKTHEG